MFQSFFNHGIGPKHIFSCHSIHFGRFKGYESSRMVKKSEMYKLFLLDLSTKVPLASFVRQPSESISGKYYEAKYILLINQIELKL